MLKWIDGKKTLIGSLLLSLLGAVWSLDLLVHGDPAWLTEQQYLALGSTVAGLTGAAMRLGIKKAENGAK